MALVAAGIAVGTGLFLAGPEPIPAPPPGRVRPPAATPTTTDLARALALPDDRRLDAVAALLIDAAGEPAQAVRLAEWFCREDAGFVREHGNSLIVVLTEHGAFAAALCFAELGGPERSEWLGRTLDAWARRDPAAAAAAALAQPGGEGLPEVASVWAAHDPEALAAFAQVIPPGPNRARTLETALSHWLQRDPAGAAAWLDEHPLAAEFDAGRVLLATMPALLQHRPDIAFGPAAAIVDPELRSRTLAIIVESWARADALGVRRYLATATELDADDRARLLAVAHRPPE